MDDDYDDLEAAIELLGEMAAQEAREGLANDSTRAEAFLSRFKAQLDEDDDEASVRRKLAEARLDAVNPALRRPWRRVALLGVDAARTRLQALRERRAPRPGSERAGFPRPDPAAQRAARGDHSNATERRHLARLGLRPSDLGVPVPDETRTRSAVAERPPRLPEHPRTAVALQPLANPQTVQEKPLPSKPAPQRDLKPAPQRERPAQPGQYSALVGQDLAAWVRQHGFTQRQAAATIGVSQPSVAEAIGKPTVQLGPKMAAGLQQAMGR